MMRRALVAIGVDRTSSVFPSLRSAALGAKHIYDWAGGQGFERELLTDENGRKVLFSDVYAVIGKFVSKGVYDQLVLYFSGHGVLMAPDCEAWLLSDAPDNQNEAINVTGSIANARTCGVAHIVIYSDACRSLPVQWRSATLTPGTVFPTRNPTAPPPEVDVFYATLPGNPALEVPPDEAFKSHRSLLTACLMDALDGKISSVIVHEKNRRVVPSRPLKEYLANAIPDAAARVSIQLNQSPDSRIESALPKYLSELDGEEVSPSKNPVTKGEMVESGYPFNLKQAVFQMQGRIIPESVFAAHSPLALEEIPGSEQVKGPMKRILEAKGLKSFETGTGFTVRGIDVRTAYVADDRCDVFYQDGAAQVRIHGIFLTAGRWGKVGRQAVCIRFSDGSGVVLAVLPGYIGTIVVEDSQVVAVNYNPSRNSENYWESEKVQNELEQRRAFVAVAARNGTFRLDGGARAAHYLRQLKRVDPVLGIYAAYAYAQAGDYEGVHSIFDYMSREREPVPFDVAMLSLQFDNKNHKPSELDFTPGMPMLTQGWLSLGRFEQFMPDPLKAARRYLKRSLWTTFTKEGMDILEGEFLGGLR